MQQQPAENIKISESDGPTQHEKMTHILSRWTKNIHAILRRSVPLNDSQGPPPVKLSGTSVHQGRIIRRP